MSNNGNKIKIDELLEENHYLKERNEFLERCVEALKLNNSRITIERNHAIDKLHEIQSLGMFEFADKYCNDKQLREAGHEFARSLGVGGK